MPRTRTLAQLRDDVLWQCDRQGASLRNDPARVDRINNQSIAEFRELVSEGGNPYFLQSYSGSLSVGPTSPYHWGVLDLSSLSPAHLRVYGFDIRDSQEWISLEPALFRERNDVQRSLTSGNARPLQFFEYTRSSIAYAPASDQAYPFLLHYLPVHTDLVADGDTFDGMNGWEDWVVFNSVSRLMLRDRDEHLERFQAERAAILARVMHVARQRQRAGAVVRGGNFGDRRGRRGPFPFPIAGGSDGLNEPGTGEVGRVAVARSDGKLNWLAGADEGDTLDWHRDTANPVGFSWGQRRHWLRPDIDLTGVADASAEIQRCLNARHGACVELPDGIIRLNAPVTVPRGCALVARPSGMSFGHKQFNQITNVGTRVDVRHTGRAIIPQEQTTVEGLCLYYPDQVTTGSSPVDYDYAFYVANGAYGVSLLNNTIMNAYRGVFISANGGLIDTMQGAPMLRGIDLGRCADVIRVNNVQFNAGGSAGTADPTLVAWVRANLTAFGVDGADGAIFQNCFSYGANIGIDFQDIDGDNPNHPSVVTWEGGGIDTGTNAIRVPSNGSLWKLLMSDVFLIGISSHIIYFADDVAGAFKPLISMSNLSSFNGSTGAIAKWDSTSYGRLLLNNAEVSGYSGYAFQSASSHALARLNAVGCATTSRVDVAFLGDYQDIGGWLSA